MCVGSNDRNISLQVSDKWTQMKETLNQGVNESNPAAN
jgi:hypothetical protein